MHFWRIQRDFTLGTEDVRAVGEGKLGEDLFGHHRFGRWQGDTEFLVGGAIHRLGGGHQLLPIMRFGNAMISQSLLAVPDPLHPGIDGAAGEAGAVFGANKAQRPFLIIVDTHALDHLLHRIPIDELILVHDLGVIVTDLEHFGQLAAARQRDHLGVVSILFYRYLFDDDIRMFGFKFFNQIANHGLTVLLNPGVHEFDGCFFFLLFTTGQPHHGDNNGSQIKCFFHYRHLKLLKMNREGMSK
ncbi:hypothetical protein D3C85_887040 [compost metagenome]